MSKLYFAHADGPGWRAALMRALAGLDSDGRSASLGLCYLTDAAGSDAGAVLACLREQTGVAHWAGTVGVGVCSDGVEYFDTPAAAVLTLDLPAQDFRIFSTATADASDLGAELDEWIEAARPRFGIVHGDPRHPQLEDTIGGLCARLHGGFLVGGLSSARQAHFQLADGVVDGGLSGVLFAENVAVSTRLSQGCAPIGPRHVVSRARGNLVYSLDGRPALEVFAEDLAALDKLPPSAIAGLIHVAVPVRGSDTGDYLVRNLLGVDPGRGAIAVGEMLDGVDQLMFCKRDAVSAEGDLERMLESLKKSVGSKPCGGVYFSCVARGPNLFGPDSRELKIIRRRLGSMPLAGFFGNGEISSDRLYGYSGVLTLFL